MTSKNDITGDSQKTKSSSDAYREGWDRIFGKKTGPTGDKKLPPAKKPRGPNPTHASDPILPDGNAGEL